jgi:hypothetical protein
LDTADIHQLSDISDEHQRLCTFRGLGNVVAEILAGPHAVASPDLDEAHMRALIYHDHGNQKFSARVNTRSAIEAKKDFIQTGFPLEQTQSVENICYSQPNCLILYFGSSHLQGTDISISTDGALGPKGSQTASGKYRYLVGQGGLHNIYISRSPVWDTSGLLAQSGIAAPSGGYRHICPLRYHRRSGSPFRRNSSKRPWPRVHRS